MRVVLALVILATAAASLEGQTDTAQERHGFWIGLHLGDGSAQWSCDNCGTVKGRGAFTGFLKLGGTISPHILLGADISIWGTDTSRTVGSQATQIASSSCEVYVYPNAKGGFFLNGGLGESELLDESSSPRGVLGSGLGFVVGVGFDARIARSWSVTPAVNFYWASLGNLAYGPYLLETNWQQQYLDFSLGITYQKRH